jgi:hypothetical protein
MAGISATGLVAGDWRESLASVPVEVDVDDVGSGRERFERVERGDSLVGLFLRPRERKANASRTEPGVWRGGLGDLADGCGAPGGCIDRNMVAWSPSVLTWAPISAARGILSVSPSFCAASSTENVASWWWYPYWRRLPDPTSLLVRGRCW